MSREVREEELVVNKTRDSVSGYGADGGRRNDITTFKQIRMIAHLMEGGGGGGGKGGKSGEKKAKFRM